MSVPSTNNQLFLQQAAGLLSDLELRYMEAEFDEQVQLKDDLDQAMIAYSKARLAILRSAVICTPDDIKQMQLLRQQIEKAPDVLQLVMGAARFATFMRSRFL